MKAMSQIALDKKAAAKKRRAKLVGRLNRQPLIDDIAAELAIVAELTADETDDVKQELQALNSKTLVHPLAMSAWAMEKSDTTGGRISHSCRLYGLRRIITAAMSCMEKTADIFDSAPAEKNILQNISSHATKAPRPTTAQNQPVKPERKIMTYSGKITTTFATNVTALPTRPKTTAKAPAATDHKWIFSVHPHPKKGWEMFICTLPERVERPEYDRLNEAARDIGGWFRSPQGDIPAGFTFKKKELAEQFAGKPFRRTPARTAAKRAAGGDRIQSRR